MPVASGQAQAESRALIAQFFIDLRQALRLTVPQAAHYLSVRAEVIEALETGQVEYLPEWAEISAIIMTYTAMAGVNGRPVLNAIGTLFTQLSVRAAPPRRPVQRPSMPPSQLAYNPVPHNSGRPQAYPAQPYPVVAQAQRALPPARLPRPVEFAETETDIARSGLAVSSRNLLKAGSVIASGARRLPQQALNQVRQRPQRALYALSLPLGLLVVTMHSSILATVSEPFGKAVQWVSSYVQEHYGPVRDGMRYIEVDDPRTRRADKLQITGGSY
ncbi:MAG: helix-turn-helix domain-containing protein [Hyphomicrobium sp.]|uniref:helix-turn-helix domain-containing protein n=1 Tax=Hyphomicrobium sp. TaxID=82 RepID=UPI0039E2165A